MYKFLFQLVLFFIPVALLFAVPTLVMVLAREYYTPVAGVAVQTENPQALYSMRFASSYAPYKEALVLERQPTIIAAGASRALPFRDFFFTDPSTFTNAGLPGASLDEVAESLTTILSKPNHIKVIILSLDPEDFDPTFTHQPESSDNTLAWYRTGWKDIYREWLQGEYTLGGLHAASRGSKDMGLPALVHGDGMRFDGSYRYNHILSDPQHDAHIEQQISELVEKINTQRALHFGRSTSPEALTTLTDLLAVCKAHGVYVVGFLPPFPHPLYTAMMSTDDTYRRTIQTLPVKLQEAFTAQGYGFYNFTDSSIIGGGEYEYTDGGHGSDKLYARLSVYLATHDQVLGAYMDVQSLSLHIESGTSAALLP